MANEQDKPGAGTPPVAETTPPPPSQPPPPAEAVAPAAPVPPRRDRMQVVRRWAALTWVQLLAAGLVGGLVGGTVVAAVAGDGHGDRHRRMIIIDGPGRAGGGFYERGRDHRERSWPAPGQRRQNVQPQPDTVIPQPATPAPAPTRTP